MLIGEISKRTQLSKDTIRFYEKRGLIKVQPSSSEFNNYKNYTENNFQRLNFIKKAKGFGFTLNEIGDLLELVDLNKANCVTVQAKIMTKIEDINKKIQELENMKSLIYSGLNHAQSKCGSLPGEEACQQLYP